MTVNYCTCVSCGSQFKFNKHKANLYCGMSCYREAQRAGSYKRGSTRVHKCANCNAKVAGKSPTKDRSGNHCDKVFCNRDCYNNYRQKEKSKSLGNCKCCGKEISKLNGNDKRSVYCSMTCRNEFRKPVSYEVKCISCGVLFCAFFIRSTGKVQPLISRKTCSDECVNNNYRNNELRKKKISAAFAGSKHPNWQGGSSFMRTGRFRGSNWKIIRAEIIRRDGFACVKCGLTQEQHKEKYGRDLSVNHIKPFHQFGGKTELANKPSNLETLCDSCHTKTDWEYRKNNEIQQVLKF